MELLTSITQPKRWFLQPSNQDILRRRGLIIESVRWLLDKGEWYKPFGKFDSARRNEDTVIHSEVNGWPQNRIFNRFPTFWSAKNQCRQGGTLKTTGYIIKIGLVSHHINDGKRWKKIATGSIKYRVKVFHVEMESETMDETTHIITEVIKGDAVRKFYGNKIWTISTMAI